MKLETPKKRLPFLKNQLFIDALLNVRPLDEQAVETLCRRIRSGKEKQRRTGPGRFRSAVRVTTWSGGDAAAPHKWITLRHVEFLPASETVRWSFWC